MAIELGRVPVQDLVENDYKIIGIGINRRADANGIFPVNYTTVNQAKDNLRNLILTKKGERPMNPDFGCELWNILFDEIINGDTDSRIENAIVSAVNQWLPYLEVSNIEIDAGDARKDENKIVINIGFALRINNTLRDSITINVTE
jgi:phage baseplate assembly protein W